MPKKLEGKRTTARTHSKYNKKLYFGTSSTKITTKHNKASSLVARNTSHNPNTTKQPSRSQHNPKVQNLKVKDFNPPKNNKDK
jgi:hypothetical protein